MSAPSAAANNTAVLVSLDFGEPDYAEILEELKLLAESAGVQAAALVEGRRQRPDAALFAGSGKVDEIAAVVEQQQIPLVIFNHDLTPAQMRNLATRIKARVIDRTMLILDIFAQRAQSHEGKVQVELAQLRYLSTRLVGMNQDMGQQKHAVGARGPGETKLELDRRKLDKRVHLLNDRLRQLKRHRDVQRRARSRSGAMSVSIVGYTNAGKSTLFNRLTSAGVYAADQLFATLDTTSRKVFLPGEGGDVVLSDTVGFIRHLPHGLVAAFRSTLEETAQADLLLHVVDVNSPSRDEQVAEVNKVLEEIGASGVPQIQVFNKIDLQAAPRPDEVRASGGVLLAGAAPRPDEVRASGGIPLAGSVAPGMQRDEYGRIARIFLSARTGAGVDELRAALAEVRDARGREMPGQQAVQWHPLDD